MALTVGQMIVAAVFRQQGVCDVEGKPTVGMEGGVVLQQMGEVDDAGHTEGKGGRLL